MLAVGLKETELRELQALDFHGLLSVLEQSGTVKYDWKDMACTLDVLMLGLRKLRCRISSARLGWIAWIIKPREDTLISLSAIYAAYAALQDDQTFDKVTRLIIDDLDTIQVEVAKKMRESGKIHSPSFSWM